MTDDTPFQESDRVRQSLIKQAMEDDLYWQVRRQQRHFRMDGPRHPRQLSHEEKTYRVACMLEELNEYIDAESLEDELDALVDLVVFALGTANRQGFHRFAEALGRVVDANLKKEVSFTTKRGAGFGMADLRKPDDWVAPDLSDLVERQS